MTSYNPKITQPAYFEEAAESLEEMVMTTYPSLYLSEPSILLDEGMVAIQADVPIPGREELFFIEWTLDLHEENKDYLFECSIFTAEGEELSSCFSSELRQATQQAIEECQDLLATLSDWLDLTLKV